MLENAGLVSRSRVGRTRACRLEAGALGAASSWMEDATRVWADRIDRLDGRLPALPTLEGRQSDG